MRWSSLEPCQVVESLTFIPDGRFPKEGTMKFLGRCFILCLFIGVSLSLSEDNLRAEDEKVKIEKVEVRLTDHGPVVLLQAQSHTIPIFVDQTVAGSIHAALTGVRLQRPLSHDLMHSILEAFDGKVMKTEITLKDGIYYGALTVEVQGAEKVFDSRSSDSIALAIHFKAPILVSHELLETAGKSKILELEAPTETL